MAGAQTLNLPGINPDKHLLFMLIEYHHQNFPTLMTEAQGSKPLDLLDNTLHFAVLHTCQLRYNDRIIDYGISRMVSCVLLLTTDSVPSDQADWLSDFAVGRRVASFNS